MQGPSRAQADIRGKYQSVSIGQIHKAAALKSKTIAMIPMA
jgi:hypothetical protein